MQIVENLETRLSTVFLGTGDHLQSYGAIFTDRAATGSGNLKNSMSTLKVLKFTQSTSLSHVSIGRPLNLLLLVLV